MGLLKTAFLSKFWSKVLCRIDATSKALQSETINLHDAMDLLTSLENFRGPLPGGFVSFYVEARGASANSEYKVKRVRCKSTESL